MLLVTKTDRVLQSTFRVLKSPGIYLGQDSESPVKSIMDAEVKVVYNEDGDR